MSASLEIVRLGLSLREVGGKHRPAVESDAKKRSRGVLVGCDTGRLERQRGRDKDAVFCRTVARPDPSHPTRVSPCGRNSGRLAPTLFREDHDVATLHFDEVQYPTPALSAPASDIQTDDLHACFRGIGAATCSEPIDS